MQISQCANDESHRGAIGRVIFPAAADDIPEIIHHTVGLGEAPMAIDPNLNYHGFEPAVSSAQRRHACRDLEVGFREQQENIS